MLPRSAHSYPPFIVKLPLPSATKQGGAGELPRPFDALPQDASHLHSFLVLSYYSLVSTHPISWNFIMQKKVPSFSQMTYPA